MKWFFVAFACAAVIAAGRFLRSRPESRFVLLFLLGFLPFTDLVERGSLNLVSHELYRGDARGFEITIIDLVALTLWVSLPKGRWPVPYRRLAIAYAAVAGITLLWAWEPLYAGFGLWRIARITFVGIVVARALEDERAPPALLHGLAWGLVAQVVFALWQRYVVGAHQVSGSFAHQNTLGMAVNLVAPIFLALLLAGAKRRVLAAAAVAAGAVCVVLTLSRGALVMLPAGLALVYLGSLARQPTTLKIRVGIVALILGTALTIKSLDTIVDRFLHAPEASARGRALFESASARMLADHPLGIGLNNFSHVLAAEYGASAGLPEYDQSGIVHHIYWLTAAELGYLGLLVYLAFVVYPIVVGARWLRRWRADPRGDVILGCTAGLIVTAGQGVLEWLSRQTVMGYLIWIQMVLILALVRQLRERSDA